MEAFVALFGNQFAGFVLVWAQVFAVEDHVAFCRAGAAEKFHSEPPLGWCYTGR